MADGITTILESMQRLKEMNDKGVISEEEYNRARGPMMEQLMAATKVPTPTGTASLVAAAEGSAAGAGGASAGGSGSGNPEGTQLRPSRGRAGGRRATSFCHFSPLFAGACLASAALAALRVSRASFGLSRARHTRASNGGRARALRARVCAAAQRTARTRARALTTTRLPLPRSWRRQGAAVGFLQGSSLGSLPVVWCNYR